MEGGLEVGQLAEPVEPALHLGDVRMVAAVAELLVEDLQEHAQDRIAPAAAVGLAVDVEQDDVGTGVDGALDVAGEHGVLDLAVEKINRPARLALVADLPVLQQVGEDLQEVRLARAEEAGDPDTDEAEDTRVAGVVERVEEGAEEAAEVDVQLLGDDILVQLLPDRRGIVLVGLDDAVDGAVDRFGEEVFDEHFEEAGKLRSGEVKEVERRGRREFGGRRVNTLPDGSWQAL